MLPLLLPLNSCKPLLEVLRPENCTGRTNELQDLLAIARAGRMMLQTPLKYASKPVMKSRVFPAAEAVVEEAQISRDPTAKTITMST
jgi:hypothetical protein